MATEKKPNWSVGETPDFHDMRKQARHMVFSGYDVSLGPEKTSKRELLPYRLDPEKAVVNAPGTGRVRRMLRNAIRRDRSERISHTTFRREFARHWNRYLATGELPV